jgi:hypothetical protein
VGVGYHDHTSTFEPSLFRRAEASEHHSAGALWSSLLTLGDGGREAAVTGIHMSEVTSAEKLVMVITSKRLVMVEHHLVKIITASVHVITYRLT